MALELRRTPVAIELPTALDLPPSLGTKPVSLRVDAGPAEQPDALADGLRSMFRRSEFCDVALICGGQFFPCHRLVLVAQSEVFREGLRESPVGPSIERQEVRLVDIVNPEAVRFMLDFMYEVDVVGRKDYAPATQEITKDVLRLAHRFRLPGLVQRAARWLARDITTGNVVERLAICSEFKLDGLSRKIIEELTVNRIALREVAGSPQIMKHPGLMKALLQQAASTGGEVVEATPKKKARAACAGGEGTEASSKKSAKKR